MKALRPQPAVTRPATTGLQLGCETTFDEWAAMGRELGRLSSGCAWCIGDWVLHGERSYGKRYKMALEATNLDYQTLRNYAHVARRFEMYRRRDTLSFHHHAEVTGMASVAEQDLWLRRAETQGWSRNELRRQLAAHRVKKDSP